MEKDINLVEHELRIRALERTAKDINETMRHIDIKLDSQFKWTIGILITLFCGSIITKLI